MTSIKVRSGLNEFQDFLKKKDIRYQISVQEALDTGVIIELIGIAVGIANILIEFKKWLSENNKKDKQIILIVNNTEVNINKISVDEIKRIK